MPIETKSILILHPSIDIVGPRSIRATNIARHLGKDYNVEIISFRTSKNEITIPNTKIIRIVPSPWIKLFYTYFDSPQKEKKIFSKFIKIIKKSLKDFIFPDPWIIEQRKIISYFNKKEGSFFDYIITSLGPFSTANLAYKLKSNNFKNTKVILDIGDPLVMNMENIRLNKRYIKYEKNILQNSFHTVVTNQKTKEYYLDECGIDSNKISVIKQGVTNEFFKQNNLLEKKSTSKIKILYAGAFYKKLREPDVFLSAFETLKCKNISIDIFDSLNYLSTNINFKNINIYPKVSQIELIDFYKRADYLLYFDNTEGIQTPGKIYELLALKKPVIFIYTNEESEIYNEVVKFNNIIFCKNIKEEIERCLSSLGIAVFSFNYNQIDFSWEKRVIQYREIINYES